MCFYESTKALVVPFDAPTLQGIMKMRERVEGSIPCACPAQLGSFCFFLGPVTPRQLPSFPRAVLDGLGWARLGREDLVFDAACIPGDRAR